MPSTAVIPSSSDAGEGGEPGDTAARGGGAAQRDALLLGKRGQLVKVRAHELLVRSDDVLARAHGRAEVAVCWFDAAQTSTTISMEGSRTISS